MTTKTMEAEKGMELIESLTDNILELLISNHVKDDYLSFLLLFGGKRPVGYRPWEDDEKNNINDCSRDEDELIDLLEPGVYHAYMEERDEQRITQFLLIQEHDI